MSKYEVDDFMTPPDPDLICCICRNVLYKPLESPCQHVFCKICIMTWLNDHRSCPSCREHLSNSRLKPVLPIVRNMINRLLIKCENHSHGCNKGIKLESYERHVKECDFALVGCLNSGCVKNIIRKDILKHEKECLHRLVKCKKGCGLPITVAEMREHSCIQSLQTTMQDMEESFNKRLKDLEEKMSHSYQDLEDRVYRVEGDLDQSYKEDERYNEERQRKLGQWDRDGEFGYRSRSHSYSPSYGPSRSRSRSRSRSHSRSRSRSSRSRSSRSRSRSSSHSRSRSHSHSRSPSRSRSRSHSHSRSHSPGYESNWSQGRSYDSSDGSPRASFPSTPYHGYYEDGWQYDSNDEPYTWTEDSPVEGTFSSAWEEDDSPYPDSSPSGHQGTPDIAVSETRTPSSSNRRSANSASTSSQVANQQQARDDPDTAGTSATSQPASSRRPEPETSRFQGRVSPIYITRRLVIDDSPESPPAAEQPAITASTSNQDARPGPPQGDFTVSGSLYGVTVGDTDSEDTEWQPENEGSSSDSDTASAEDSDDDGHDLSGNDNSTEASTSDGRTTRSSTKRKRQGERDSENQPTDRPGSSRLSGGLQEAAAERNRQRDESQNVEQMSCSRRRRRSPSAEAEDQGERRSHIKKKRRKK